MKNKKAVVDASPVGVYEIKKYILLRSMKKIDDILVKTRRIRKMTAEFYGRIDDVPPLETNEEQERHAFPYYIVRFKPITSFNRYCSFSSFPYYIVRFKRYSFFREISDPKQFPYYIVRFKHSFGEKFRFFIFRVSILHSTI